MLLSVKDAAVFFRRPCRVTVLLRSTMPLSRGKDVFIWLWKSYYILPHGSDVFRWVWMLLYCCHMVETLQNKLTKSFPSIPAWEKCSPHLTKKMLSWPHGRNVSLCFKLDVTWGTFQKRAPPPFPCYKKNDTSTTVREPTSTVTRKMFVGSHGTHVLLLLRNIYDFRPMAGMLYTVILHSSQSSYIPAMQLYIKSVQAMSLTR